MNNRRTRWTIRLIPVMLLPFMLSCEDMINPRLIDLIIGDGAYIDVTPNVKNLILIKFVNETEYVVNLACKVHHPSGIDEIPMTLRGSTSVSKLVKDCDTDPPSIIRLKFLGEDNDEDYPAELAFPEVFVVVNGIPTLISNASPPVYIDQDYTCGAAVMFVVRAVSGEKMKYEAITYIYAADPSEVALASSIE